MTSSARQALSSDLLPTALVEGAPCLILGEGQDRLTSFFGGTLGEGKLKTLINHKKELPLRLQEGTARSHRNAFKGKTVLSQCLEAAFGYFRGDVGSGPSLWDLPACNDDSTAPKSGHFPSYPPPKPRTQEHTLEIRISASCHAA